MISPTERMIAESDGAIGWMTFNNPPRHNALSLDMWQAMPVILDHFARDPDVRVIVLRGAGDKAFISGADISQFEKQRSSAESIAQYDKIAEGALAALQEVSKPTIAMIHGFCIGGGLGVALGCDLRIAAENARFVGPAYAKEIFFTARHFTAAEAQGMRLINRAVPEAELEGYVRNYCALIAENAPLTMEAVKGVVAEIGKPGMQIDRPRCEALVARCFDSKDYVEGRRAFMEGHPRGRARPQSPDRGPDHPRPHPRPQRGAAQGADASRRQIRRAGAHLRAQCAARRTRRPQKAGKRPQDHARPAPQAGQGHPDLDRRDDQEDRWDAGPEGQGNPSGLSPWTTALPLPCRHRRRMWPSSWMAMAAGRSHAACRASPGTAAAPMRCGAPSPPPPSSASPI